MIMAYWKNFNILEKNFKFRDRLHVGVNFRNFVPSIGSLAEFNTLTKDPAGYINPLIQFCK